MIRIGDLQVDATARGRIDALREHLVPTGWQAPDSDAPAGITRRQQRQREHTDGRADDRRQRDHRGAASATSRTTPRRSGPSRSVASSRSATASPGCPGLPGAAVNELLEFEDGTLGLALNLDEDTIGAVVLGEVDNLEEEQTVKATGRILSVPGRRRPARAGSSTPSASRIDGKGPVDATETRRMEVQAPGIVGRQPVSEPLQTGIKAIDAMTPIGRGPARADHRRPQDGQDHGGHRHDHQPGAARA